MSNDVSIVTKKSLKDKVIQYFAVGAGVFFIYGTFHYGNEYFHRRDCRSRVQKAMLNEDCDLADKIIDISVKEKGIKILEAEEYRSKIKETRVNRAKKNITQMIKSQKFGLAKEHIQESHEKGLVSHIEIQEFLLSIKKSEGETNFYEALTNYDLTTAKKVLDELKGLNVYETSDIIRLEDLIQSRTPEGLFANIKNSKLHGSKNEFPNFTKSKGYSSTYPFGNSDNGFSRSVWCKEYLSVYPDSPHKDEVVQILLVDSFKILLEYAKGIDHNHTFKETSDILKDLNNCIKVYGSKDLGIARIINIDHVLSELKEYIEKRCHEVSNMAPSIGDRVKVVTHQSEGWGAAYYNERQINFPIGMEGTIIDKNEKGDLLIAFDEGKKYHWTADWFPNYKDNVALFRSKEIKSLLSRDSIDVQQFDYEIDNLKKLYNLKIK